MSERRGPGRPRGRPPKTEEEIRAAAAQVFRAVGYHEARMDDVARALGITKGSLYYYVPTKEDLLFAVVLPPYREAVAHLEEVAASDQDAPSRIRALVRRYVTNVVRHYPAISVYLENHRHLPVPQEVRELDSRYTAGVRTIIVEGMEEGSLRVQNPAVAAAALLGMCSWFAVRYQPDSDWDVEEVGREFSAVFLDGLARPVATPLRRTTR